MIGQCVIEKYLNLQSVFLSSFEKNWEKKVFVPKNREMQREKEKAEDEEHKHTHTQIIQN